MCCLRVAAHVAILATETRREVIITHTQVARILALASTGSPKALIIAQVLQFGLYSRALTPSAFPIVFSKTNFCRPEEQLLLTRSPSFCYKPPQGTLHLC